MIVRARADKVRLDTDESGWQLVVDTDEGDTFVIDIHGAAYEFAGSGGLARLLGWRSEGEHARTMIRGGFSCMVDESAGQYEDLLRERYGD